MKSIVSFTVLVTILITLISNVTSATRNLKSKDDVLATSRPVSFIFKLKNRFLQKKRLIYTKKD